MTGPAKLLDAALEAARACGGYLLDNYRRPKSGYEEKSPGDLVSEVDRTSQSMARDILLTHTPEAHYLAEEGEASRGAAGAGEGLVWIVDPLDGTANFLHRFPAFSISIAAARGSRLLAGVVFNPVTDELFAASREGGATLNGEPIRVSEEADLKKSMLATGWPFRRLELMDDYLEVFKGIFRHCQGMRRPGAASLDLAYTAAGRLEGYWEFGLKIWDLAAGALIVEQAGGRVTGFRGGEEWMESGDIVATNGHVHRALLEAAAIPGGLEELEERAGIRGRL